MHCIQFIATQADSKQEAFDEVKANLENRMGDDENLSSWYDWFVTGGGRWSTSDDPYNDNYTADVAHQSDSKFQEYLDTAVKYRSEELARYVEKARQLNLSEVLDLVEAGEEDYFKAGHQLYDIKQIYEMTLGVWNFNSYFFDIVNDQIIPKYMQESINNGAKNWYLVPVDFHF